MTSHRRVRGLPTLPAAQRQISYQSNLARSVLHHFENRLERLCVSDLFAFSFFQGKPKISTNIV